MHGAGVETTGTSAASAAGNAITGLEIVGGNIVVTFGERQQPRMFRYRQAIGGVTVTSVTYNVS